MSRKALGSLKDVKRCGHFGMDGGYRFEEFFVPLRPIKEKACRVVVERTKARAGTGINFQQR